MTGIPSGSLLLVSPHLDDVVLSCSAVVERGEPVDVLTVFAGAPDPPQLGWWDEECGFSSSAESMPERLREDEAAFAGTAHRREYLQLLEVQYIDQARGAEAATPIVDAVTAWLARNPTGAVAFPAGAGCRSGPLGRRLRRLLHKPCNPPQHPDHLYVRDVVMQVLADRPESTPLLYEELPYLFGAAAEREVQRVARRGHWQIEAIVTPIDRSAKAARIAAYSSQVPHLSPAEGRLDETATLPQEERYWRLRRSSTSS